MENNLSRLYLSVTNACNIRCKHCFRRAGMTMDGELKIEEFRKILESSVNAVASKQVSITGGEPFMRKDLFDILDITKELGLSVDLSTNGLLLNEEIIHKLAEYDNIFYMQISVDGITKDSYEFIRGKNTYDKLIQNLSIIKDSQFLQQIDLMMIYLATPRNYMEIPAIPEFARKYGFDKIAIGEILPFGNGSEEFQYLDISTYINEIYVGIDIARSKKIVDLVDQFHFGFLKKGDMPTPCTAREGKLLAIEPDGSVLVCPYDTDLSVGNIREFNYDVASAYKFVTEKTADMFKHRSNVNNCEFFEKCQGGCPLINKKNNTECDERCKKLQEKLKLEMM